MVHPSDAREAPLRANPGQRQQFQDDRSVRRQSGSIARDLTPGSLLYWLFRTREVVSGVDKRNMRKCLGEIANQSLRSGSYSSDRSPTSFLSVSSRSNNCCASSRRPVTSRLSASQKLQARNAPSPGGGRRGCPRCHSVGQGRPPINVARSRQSCFEPLDHRASKKPTAGMSSKLASRFFDPYDCTKAPIFGSNA